MEATAAERHVSGGPGGELYAQNLAVAFHQTVERLGDDPAIVEKIRGAPVPLRIMERSGMVGFALVLILFVIGLENDIGRLTGEGFNVR